MDEIEQFLAGKTLYPEPQSTCPVCGQPVRVMHSGFFRPHKTGNLHFEDQQRKRGYCRGSVAPYTGVSGDTSGARKH